APVVLGVGVVIVDVPRPGRVVDGHVAAVAAVPRRVVPVRPVLVAVAAAHPGGVRGIVVGAGPAGAACQPGKQHDRQAAQAGGTLGHGFISRYGSLSGPSATIGQTASEARATVPARPVALSRHMREGSAELIGKRGRWMKRRGSSVMERATRCDLQGAV